MMSFLYWIYNDTCHNPKTDGYIGITSKPLEHRLKRHLRNRRVPPDVQIKALYEGTRDECFCLENEYRPVKGIGWNSCPGGKQGWRHGYKLSEKQYEQRLIDLQNIQAKGVAAMAKLRKGSQLTEEHRRNIGLGQQGHPAYPTQQKVTSERSQKTYIVTNPQGKEITVTNLRQFCLENKLHQSNMIYKKCGSRGWKAVKVE